MKLFKIKANESVFDFSSANIIFVENKITEEIKEIEEKNNIEPFKTEVTKLKDIYENIKLEIKKLSD